MLDYVDCVGECGFVVCWLFDYFQYDVIWWQCEMLVQCFDEFVLYEVCIEYVWCYVQEQLVVVDVLCDEVGCVQVVCELVEQQCVGVVVCFVEQCGG